MNKKEKAVPNAAVVNVREDMWMISDSYLSAAFHMVAEQFIADDVTTYVSRNEFIERAEYVLRQHCPIVYSYYFDWAGLKVLPSGSVDVLLEIIRKQRPLFLQGSDKPHAGIILPNS